MIYIAKRSLSNLDPIEIILRRLKVLRRHTLEALKLVSYIFPLFTTGIEELECIVYEETDGRLRKTIYSLKQL